MNDHDESKLADRRNAFLRHLPTRAEVIGRRLNRFLQSGWDINGLSLIYSDACRLGDGSEIHGLDQTAEPLRAIAELLKDALDQEQLPDLELGERLCALAQTLNELVPPAPAVASDEFVPANLAEEFALMAAADAAQTKAADAALVEDEVNAWGDGVARPPPAKAAA